MRLICVLICEELFGDMFDLIDKLYPLFTLHQQTFQDVSTLLKNEHFLTRNADFRISNHLYMALKIM